MSVTYNNLYDPIMYMIEQHVRREFNDLNGGPTGEKDSVLEHKEYIEGIKLHRDGKGRLQMVEGWFYLDYELSYNDKGLLSTVDARHKLTGKHLRISLLYDDKNILQEVDPEIISEGSGSPGKMNLPDVVS